MRPWNILLLALVLIIIGGLVFYSLSREKKSAVISPALNTNSKNTMKIASLAFQNNENMPPKYSCDGENISPPLEISDIPARAKSLALVLHDPDAPLSGGFTHWVVWNINPSTKEIPEGSPPQNSVEGLNSSGRAGYTGPCPPSGVHHYEFRLYALDEKLNLDTSVNKDGVEKAMEGHILEQSLLVGLYKRP